MNGRLQDARTKKCVCQRVCDGGPAGQHGNEHDAAEDRKAFDAVRVRTCQALHEWREVRVVRSEPVCRNGFGEDELGANDLHEHQEEQRPGDEANEGGERGIHTRWYGASL